MWSWWESSCCLMYFGNGNCFFFSFSFQAILALLLNISGGKYDTWICEPLQCDNVSFSLRFVVISVPLRIFRMQATRNTSVLACFSRQLLSLLWHCANKFRYQFSSSFQCRWPETWVWSLHQKILDFAGLSFSEYVSCCQECENLVVRTTWIAFLGVPHSIVRQIHVRAIHPPMLLPNCWMHRDLRLRHTM